jgi:hypothetical protein
VLACPLVRQNLGSLLVSQGLITPHQLDQALKSQVIFGGRLGTNLVELGALDLETLSRALSQHFGVPAALQKHFDQIQPQAVQLLPKQLAHKHLAIPLGLPKQTQRTLAVAFENPGKVEAIDEVAFATGMRVMATVAPELRLLHYLEKLYGIPRKTRFLRIVAATAEPTSTARIAPPPAADRRRFLDPNALPPPPPPAAEPAAAHELSDPAPPIEVPADLRLPSSGGRPALSVAEALAQIQAATSRDAVGDALVDQLRSSFGAGLVLIVKEGMALGWRGYAPGVAPSALESAAFPLGMPSSLQLAFERKAPFRGVPASQGAALHSRLWKLLQTPAPKEVLVAPVAIKDRVVLLIYAQGINGEVLHDTAVQECAQLAAAASTTFARLIKEAKAKV